MNATPIFLSVSLSFLLISCGEFSFTSQDGSLGSPLDSPATKYSSRNRENVNQVGGFRKGQWIETTNKKTPFYINYPKGSAQANQLLSSGLPLQVIKTRRSYVKVKTREGVIGYVPAIMVAETGANSEAALVPVPPEAPLPELPELPQLENEPEIEPYMEETVVPVDAELPLPEVSDLPELPSEDGFLEAGDADIVPLPDPDELQGIEETADIE